MEHSFSLGASLRPVSSALLFLGLAVIGAQAYAEGRLTDSSGAPVMNPYDECWQAAGGSTATMEACGDVVPQAAVVTPMPRAQLEVVTAPTAASLTGTVDDQIEIAAAMLFGFDSAELTDDARAVIDERVQALRGRARLTSTMLIEGHTDSIGPAEYNLRLSERRAQAVADYILSQAYRLSAEDIQVVGLGEDQPVASNATTEGRAENRRVVLFATGKLE
jgi:OOP family OmpA-OmpF porin